MPRLRYTAICSLDGYVADEHGSFDWAAPDEEVHAFVNDRERGIGTYLYGRRMYEVMRAWEDPAMDAPGEPPVIHDYAALWRAADKVVYSRSLEAVSTARTRLERTFEPEAVRRLVAAAPTDVSIGGPELAGEALRAGIVDEVALLVVPAVVGGGTAALPAGVRLDLELTDERRFANGTVLLVYDVRGARR